MNILIAVTGGIAAYKAPDIISGLQATGHTCHVMMTENAKKFITPLTLATISNGKYIEEDNLHRITHIDEAHWTDLFLCAPATANTIAKFANGFADNLVTSTFLALGGQHRRDHHQIVICPAMNTYMLQSDVTEQNISLLKNRGCDIMDPVDGLLACGDEGPGKLPKPRKIVEYINNLA